MIILRFNAIAVKRLTSLLASIVGKFDRNDSPKSCSNFQINNLDCESSLLSVGELLSAFPTIEKMHKNSYCWLFLGACSVNVLFTNTTYSVIY